MQRFDENDVMHKSNGVSQSVPTFIGILLEITSLDDVMMGVDQSKCANRIMNQSDGTWQAFGRPVKKETKFWDFTAILLNDSIFLTDFS